MARSTFLQSRITELRLFWQVHFPYLVGNAWRVSCERSLELACPLHCLLCGVNFDGDGSTQICPSCDWSHESRTQISCPRCGAKVLRLSANGHGCRHCAELRFRFQSVVSLGNYTGNLRNGVLQLKKPGSEALANEFGKRLRSAVMSEPWWPTVDCVVPMATQWSRRWQRGINVAEILADRIVLGTQIRSLRHLLQYSRATKKQGTLSRIQRFENLRGSIQIGSNRNRWREKLNKLFGRPLLAVQNVDLKDRTVLIVDDVMTSGATADEVARVLKSAGAEKIFVAVVARGVGSI